MVPEKILKVCVLLVLACVVPTAGQTRCRICKAARSLDDCTVATTCGPDEKCYMDEVVSETLAIEYSSGCRAKDVCSSAIHMIGKRALDKRDSFVACSRCCDSSPTYDGNECNTKLCGIKFIYQMSQCYMCDSTIAGGQGDVKDPTECASYTTCQTDEVCGSQTFALGMNVTHRMTCLSRRICTLLTHRALEDIKRCKDKANIAAGLCGSRKRSGQMVCTACCGDAVCNGGACDDVLERLYNLWTSNALNFDTLKATGPLQHPSNVYSASATKGVLASLSTRTTNIATTASLSKFLSSSSSMLSKTTTSLVPTVASAKQTLTPQTFSTSTKGKATLTVSVSNQSFTSSVTSRSPTIQPVSTLSSRQANSTVSLATTNSTPRGTSNNLKRISTSQSNVSVSFPKSSPPSSPSPPTRVSIPSSSSSLSASTISASFGTPLASSSVSISTPPTPSSTSTLLPLLLVLSSLSSTPRVTFTTVRATKSTSLQTTPIVKFTASPNSQTTRFASSRTTGTRTKVQFTAFPKHPSVTSSVATTSSVSKVSSGVSVNSSLNGLGSSKSDVLTTVTLQTHQSSTTTVNSFGNKIRKPTGSEEIIPHTILNLTPTSMYGNPARPKATVTSPSH